MKMFLEKIRNKSDEIYYNGDNSYIFLNEVCDMSIGSIVCIISPNFLVISSRRMRFSYKPFTCRYTANQKQVAS